MFRALLLLSLTLPCLASADVDPRFAKLRDTADALSSLGAFLDKYIGDCSPVSEGGSDCGKNAEAFRRAANGHKFYMILTEESTAVLSMGAFNPKGGEVFFHEGSNSGEFEIRGDAILASTSFETEPVAGDYAAAKTARDTRAAL